jgi:hypothetical protein
MIFDYSPGALVTAGLLFYLTNVCAAAARAVLVVRPKQMLHIATQPAMRSPSLAISAGASAQT